MGKSISHQQWFSTMEEDSELNLNLQNSKEHFYEFKIYNYNFW